MRSTSDKFRKGWTYKFAACLFAVLAMCVSTVSACACVHHQPRAAAEPPSCHSVSHGEAPVVADEQNLSNSVDNGCNCFVSIPSPAVASKSENKKTATERTAPITVEVDRVQPVVLAVFLAETEFPLHRLKPSDHLTESGPSRAPPRL